MHEKPIIQKGVYTTKLRGSFNLKPKILPSSEDEILISIKCKRQCSLKTSRGRLARATRKFFPNQGGNIDLKMSLVKNIILKGAATRMFSKCEMLMK